MYVSVMLVWVGWAGGAEPARPAPYTCIANLSNVCRWVCAVSVRGVPPAAHPGPQRCARGGAHRRTLPRHPCLRSPRRYGLRRPRGTPRYPLQCCSPVLTQDLRQPLSLGWCQTVRQVGKPVRPRDSAQERVALRHTARRFQIPHASQCCAALLCEGRCCLFCIAHHCTHQ